MQAGPEQEEILQAIYDVFREYLLPILRCRFLQASAAEWEHRLAEAGVPVGRVMSVVDALKDPQVQARAGVVGYEHPRLGQVRQVASPLNIGDFDPVYAPAPDRGAQTAAVLKELCGYDDSRLASARRAGAFGRSSDEWIPNE
jgi:crotonobetainyl-CoA:carnitine CoA-transferase CaiB-like acyl-CoA transferase